MTILSPICIIGQIIVDVTLAAKDRPLKMRLGGIVHASRTLWALNAPYILGYIAPTYLEPAIQKYVAQHGCVEAVRIGTVDGSPNVMLINEPKEAGPQGYEYLLRDEHDCTFDLAALRGIQERHCPSDIVLFPGGFNLRNVLKILRHSSARIYSDANFEPYRLRDFKSLGRQFETLILSTSATVFQEHYKGRFKNFVDEVHGCYAHTVLLKENRGGSRFAGHVKRKILSVPAQVRLIQHSIGVGDCFDVAFASVRRAESDRTALAYASAIAAEYASTTYPDKFKTAVEATMRIPPHDIVAMRGVVLPWESRAGINIYVAAPDFDYIDRSYIDQIVDALKYHNFTPRMPVRENGQMGKDADRARRQALCDADIRMLRECQLVVAIVLFNDPGTLIEIGMAIEAGKPVIVFDPYGRADNLILTELPSVVTADMDEVIATVFSKSAELVTE